ncbi:MAG: SGNH/GDSL hydrolase family protein [Isosphaeraceae bacterium]|nr:SGNH/GDSL hydrolase family protein [Isosphaeraceae bacterium]
MDESIRDHGMMRLLVSAVLLAASLGLPARLLEGRAGRVLGAMMHHGPNDRDLARIERGYYEGLGNAMRRFDRTERASSGFDAGELAVSTNDAREFVLRPNLETMHKGVRWATNSEGMRDRERSIAKPPGTYRIVLVGDSIAAGWGVDLEQGFARGLERILDRPERRVEVLDLAVPGHAPGQRWEHFLRVGRRFEADLVIFEGSAADLEWDRRRMRAFVGRGLGFDSPVYSELLRAAGIERGDSVETANRKLEPIRRNILPRVYRTIAESCRTEGIPVVWLLVPRVGKRVDPEARAGMVECARAAGFEHRIDLSSIFDGLDPARLSIGSDDFHPNAEGHSMIARELARALTDLDLDLEAGPVCPEMEGVSR